MRPGRGGGFTPEAGTTRVRAMAKPKSSAKTSNKTSKKAAAAKLPPSTGLDTTSGEDSERPPLAPGVKYRRILLKLSGEALMGD